MKLTRLTLQSGTLSILLHLAAAGLLVLSLDFSRIPVIQPDRQDVEIVQAVSVDSKQVEQELQRLKDIEQAKQQKQQELEQKLRELERQSTQAEKKRREEEKRLVELEQQKAAERKAREQEQQKLADLKKQQVKLEQERQAEQARIKKAEQEKQRLAEEQQRQEEERKRKEAEAALQQQLAAERRRQQERQDQALLQNITNNIYRRVVNNFNISGLPPGLECVISVRTIPGGEVVNVSISRSSGNEIFDRRAINATQKASPLPLPEDVATFERLNLRQFSFVFKP